jgi:hypothetical protein
MPRTSSEDPIVENVVTDVSVSSSGTHKMKGAGGRSFLSMAHDHGRVMCIVHRCTLNPNPKSKPQNSKTKTLTLNPKPKTLKPRHPTLSDPHFLCQWHPMTRRALFIGPYNTGSAAWMSLYPRANPAGWHWWRTSW